MSDSCEGSTMVLTIINFVSGTYVVIVHVIANFSYKKKMLSKETFEDLRLDMIYVQKLCRLLYYCTENHEKVNFHSYEEIDMVLKMRDSIKTTQRNESFSGCSFARGTHQTL